MLLRKAKPASYAIPLFVFFFNLRLDIALWNPANLCYDDGGGVSNGSKTSLANWGRANAAACIWNHIIQNHKYVRRCNKLLFDSNVHTTNYHTTTEMLSRCLYITGQLVQVFGIIFFGLWNSIQQWLNICGMNMSSYLLMRHFTYKYMCFNWDDSY